jgi:hypothetical protein
MAIVGALNAPEKGPEIIERALRDLYVPSSKDGLGGGKLELSQPFPVYRLDLKRLKSARDIANAELFGWRYLVEHPRSDGVGYADVKTSAEGAQFTSFSKQSINVYRLMEAAHLAQQVAEESNTNYEARILEIPQIYFSSIWLAGAKSILIPYIDRTTLFASDASVKAHPVEYLMNLTDR